MSYVSLRHGTTELTVVVVVVTINHQNISQSEKLTLRLSRPGELDDGVAAPGLDPVLGGGLQHLPLAVVLSVVLVVVVVVVVVWVIPPLTPLELVDSPGQLCGGESEVVSLVTVPPRPLISPPHFTLVISPGPQPPSPPPSPSPPSPVTPLSLGNIL